MSTIRRPHQLVGMDEEGVARIESALQLQQDLLRDGWDSPSPSGKEPGSALLFHVGAQARYGQVEDSPQLRIWATGIKSLSALGVPRLLHSFCTQPSKVSVKLDPMALRIRMAQRSRLRSKSSFLLFSLRWLHCYRPRRRGKRSCV